MAKALVRDVRFIDDNSCRPDGQRMFKRRWNDVLNCEGCHHRYHLRIPRTTRSARRVTLALVTRTAWSRW